MVVRRCVRQSGGSLESILKEATEIVEDIETEEQTLKLNPID